MANVAQEALPFEEVTSVVIAFCLKGIGASASLAKPITTKAPHCIRSLESAAPLTEVLFCQTIL